MTRAEIKTQVDYLLGEWASQEPNEYTLGKVNAMRIILENTETAIARKLAGEP